MNRIIAFELIALLVRAWEESQLIDRVTRIGHALTASPTLELILVRRRRR